jgi:PIN domain nuclease of toxin-antitoxin system
VRLLLDTHIAIWALTEPARLGAAAALVADPEHEVFVSAVSVLEIAVKRARGQKKGKPPFSAEEALRVLPQAGYRFLDVTPRHAALVETLPRLHADPFDRLLVAQALAEPLRLVTADAMVARYSDTVIRVP